jgi:hypothetical protein
VGCVAGNIIYHSLGGPVEKYMPLARRLEFRPEGKHLFLEIFFWGGGAAKLRWGGAERPFWRVNEPKKTRGHSARAGTRGQNPLVFIIYLSRVLCLCVCVCVSQLRNAMLFF